MPLYPETSSRADAADETISIPLKGEQWFCILRALETPLNQGRFSRNLHYEIMKALEAHTKAKQAAQL
jgi:hypothetical protein